MQHSALRHTQQRAVTCRVQPRAPALLGGSLSSTGHRLQRLSWSAAAPQHGCTRGLCRRVCSTSGARLCSLPTSSPCSRACRRRRCLQTAAAAGAPAAGGYPRRSPEPRPPSAAAEDPQDREQKRIKRSWWTVIDVLSLLGSVAGALAALLGWLSPTYALALPLVLPVVSLIAALQREDLQQEESAVVLSRLSSSLSQDAGGVLAEARSAMEEVRRELAAQGGATNRLASLEGRLVAAEASAAAAAVAAREAAAGVGALRGGLLQEVRGGQEMVGSALRGELGRGLAALAAEEAGAAARLDARLAAVEGCLSGLEASQSEGLRRLSLTLTSNLADAEALLQSSVRAEVALALEPVRRLPQMVAAMLPPPPPPAALPAAGDLAPVGAVEGLPTAFGLSGSQQTIQQQQQQQVAALLRQLVAEEVGAALAPLAAQQADLLSRVSSPRPAPLAEEQWEALGRRLGQLEALLEDLPSTAAMAAAGQVAPLVTSQHSALVDVVEGLQQQVAAAASEQQSWQQEQAQRPVQQQDVPGGSSQEALQQQQQQQQQVLEEVLSELRELGQAQAAAMSQLQQVDALQQQLAMASSTAAEAAAQQEEWLQQQLALLRQQVDVTSASLQQLQGEVPVALAALQQAAATGEHSPGQSAAAAQATLEAVRAAAAGAAEAAAASSINEVAPLLQQLGASTLSLTQQVAQLSAAVEQQAGAVAAAAAAQQQVEGVLAAAGDMREEVAQAMSALQQQLPGELAGWEQQVAGTAPAAVADAAGAALTQALQQLLESGQLAGLVAAAVQQQSDQQQQAALASQPPSAAAAAAGPSRGMGLPGAAVTSEADVAWQYEQGWDPDMAPGQQQQQQQQPAPGSEVSLAAGSLLDSQLGPAAWQAQPWQQAEALSPNGMQQTGRQQGEIEGPPTMEPTSGSSPPPPGRFEPQQQQQQQQQRQQQRGSLDIDTLPRDQLFPAGLSWLRQGRDATRGTGPWASTGRDLAAGQVLLQGAVAAFQKALALTPGDARLLGNLGNALLAAGELKRVGRQEAVARGDTAAAEALRVEAVALLTSAGEQFRGVLEVEGWSSRALVNWGKALTGRAELATERGLGRGEGGGAVKLYSAAITKFEAVLEEEPDNLVAKYRCGLALAGLAAVTQPGRRAAELWGDAVNYLGDVASPAARAEPGLAAAAAEALRPAQDALELARLR